MSGGLYNLKKGVASEDQVVRNLVVASGNGAIDVQGSTVFITKGSAAALTLAAPTSGSHDGMTIDIVSTTAYAHTVTNSSPGFNGAGASGDVATFGAAAGNSMTVVAYGGKWYVVNLTGVTLA